MFRVLLLLWLLPPGLGLAADQWKLTIDGHHRFVFGEPVLNGYVQIPWHVELNFSVEQGRFLSGSGTAGWVNRVSSASVPQDWIACELLAGSYLDAGLNLREMPRLRFSGFPLAGRLEQGVLYLRPGYDQPGNYLAVRYGCRSEQAGAGNWFTFAARARDELGLRQDAQTREAGDQREAWISEVKMIPPSDELVLPLQDGWYFQQGREDSNYFARYRLSKLP